VRLPESTLERALHGYLRVNNKGVTMAVATRNTGDFAGMGVELINPWDEH
jgi:hypothetical protein